MAASRSVGPANRHVPAGRREPALAQVGSFVELFVWLLVLKQFFLPLFIIPTGSMAETLAGEHAIQSCSNCGFEYKVGFNNGWPRPIICPNCRWSGDPLSKMNHKSGDRVVVHGWIHDLMPSRALQRWDVVVFKDPKDGQTNFIKRLIGLPGETIELIDGDVWVNGQVPGKPHDAQQALWMPVYDHDYLPREPGMATIAEGYHPRWAPVGTASGWKGLDTRAPLFDGLDRTLEQVQFVTGRGRNAAGAEILDFYGYNGLSPPGAPWRIVTDLRVAADVRFIAGGPDAFVELSIDKYTRRFYARLYHNGRVTLESESLEVARQPAETQTGPARVLWADRTIELAGRESVRLSLGHADYQAIVEIDGEPFITSSREQYPITADMARARSGLDPLRQHVVIGAAGARFLLRHMEVERDVHYRSGPMKVVWVPVGQPAPPAPAEAAVHLRTGRPIVESNRVAYQLPGNGVQGHPITLDADEYYVLGDNSPSSGDSRMWSVDTLGPHLVADYKRGDYHIGTVPSDQMIGPAFLVYWPGFLPLTPWGVNIVPDMGRVRWIY